MDYSQAVYDQLYGSEMWKKYQKTKTHSSKSNVFFLASLSSFMLLIFFVVGIFFFIFLFLQGTLAGLG